jgi:hypothetical protein
MSNDLKIAGKYLIKQLGLGFSAIRVGAKEGDHCAECRIPFSEILDDFLSLAVVEGSLNKKMCTPCGLKFAQRGANVRMNKLPPEKQRSLRIPNILKDL